MGERGRHAGSLSPVEQLLQKSGDPAMDDGPIRALVALAHCENLWVSEDHGASNWLIDGPGECVAVAFGSSFDQWRQAVLRAAGAMQ